MARLVRLRYIRLTGRQRVRVWCAIVVTALLVLTWVVVMHLRPILVSLATTRCANTVNRVVMAAVNDAVDSGRLEYDRLISFDKDAEGHVSALRSNMAAFNRLQASVAEDVLARLAEVSVSELSVPVGTLTGSPLLAGRGPKLHVKMETLGSATARFDNRFTASGINQTKHQIVLQVDVSVTILLPGITTYTKVSNEIAVAETVIVGGVPDTYTYFSTTEESVEDYAEDYIMNNA